MSQIALTLQTPAGYFVFTREEVPEHILQGGCQAVSVQRMVGGRRIVRAMGPDEDEITFSGLFAYQGTARSDFLDGLRRRGDLCTLTWDNRRLLVIVSAYRVRYEKPYELRYSISFTVVNNETAIVDAIPAVTPTQQMQVDSNSLTQMSACSGNSALSSLASGVSTALSALQDAMQPIANGLKPINASVASAATCMGQIANTIETSIAGVAAPVAQLLASTQALITNTENAISTTASFGGIVPGNPVAQSVGKFLSQVNSTIELPGIYQMNSVAKRMQQNLSLANPGTSSKTVTVAGGSLYDVAAQQYGDANQWTKIANANGLSDPTLTGINTLNIPA